MEDGLKKIKKIGRQPKKMEDDLQKKVRKNGRLPKKNHTNGR
jgi:hypothetical protein